MICSKTKKFIYTDAYTDAYMGTKTISIMDDVYEMLLRSKKNKESFSDVIRRSLNCKQNMMDGVGLWSDLSEKDFKDVEKNIEKLRNKKRDYLK